jgi:hypothetical protein
VKGMREVRNSPKLLVYKPEEKNNLDDLGVDE